MIVLDCDGEPTPFCGTAAFMCDETLGNVLKITLDGGQGSKQEIMISETEWTGLIVADHEYGCDFCFFNPS